MRRPPDPRSELWLSAAQVRAMVACPRCGAHIGKSCSMERPSRRQGPVVHEARYITARALVRARRL